MFWPDRPVKSEIMELKGKGDAALQVAQGFALGGGEMAVEESQGVELGIGGAYGDLGVAFLVLCGGGGPCGRGAGGGGGVLEGKPGVGEVAEVAAEGDVQDLQGARESPRAYGVAGLGKRTGGQMRTGGAQGQRGKGIDGPSPEVAVGIAFGTEQGVAKNEPSTGCQGAGRFGKELAPLGGGKFVEEIVDGKNVHGLARGIEEGGKGLGACAQGGPRPAGGA